MLEGKVLHDFSFWRRHSFSPFSLTRPVIEGTSRTILLCPKGTRPDCRIFHGPLNGPPVSRPFQVSGLDIMTGSSISLIYVGDLEWQRPCVRESHSNRKRYCQLNKNGELIEKVPHKLYKFNDSKERMYTRAGDLMADCRYNQTEWYLQ